MRGRQRLRVRHIKACAEQVAALQLPCQRIGIEEAASRWFTVQKTPCLQTAEAVIGEPALEALQNAPRLRWLQMTWAGADRYLHGGFPRSVLLTTASGAFGETIAEHAIGMLLSLCRRLPSYARQKSWNDLGSERCVAGASWNWGRWRRRSSPR